MPIDSKHDEYTNMLPLQHKSRLVCEGEDAIKAKATEFLPMLGGQDIEAYEAYKDRATFFNASGRTVEGLTGVVFRKPPKFEFPKEEFKDKVTNEGDDYKVFLRELVNEEIKVGRVGILADRKDTNNNTLPHLAVYQAESIINWRTEVVDGIKTTVMVVLEEKRQDYSDDQFEPEEYTVYRVLVLTSATEQDFIELGRDSSFELVPQVNRTDDDGNLLESFFAVAVYRKNENSTNKKGKPTFTLIEEPFFPTVRGTRLKYIPFVVINPTNLSIDKLENPPILDVVNVNLSHYKVTADLKHGQHFTALPTAFVSGFKSDKPLMIGSAAAWVTEETGADAKFLEFTGAGLGALRDDLKDMQDQMAVLGSRLLEEPKRAVEAADTHRQRKAGEESVIGTIASNTESGVEKCLRWCAEWMAENPDDVEVALNKDYMAQMLEAGMLTALLSVLQQGRISYDTFMWNLAQGEMLPDGRTPEEELELILQNPALPNTNEPMDLDEEEDETIEEENEDNA